MLNVDEIQNGIVIDHITAGKGKQIYDLLNLGALPQISVALLQNVRSNKYGSKDIIKLEGDATFDFPILGYHTRLSQHTLLRLVFYFLHN